MSRGAVVKEILYLLGCTVLTCAAVVFFALMIQDGWPPGAIAITAVCSCAMSITCGYAWAQEARDGFKWDGDERK